MTQKTNDIRNVKDLWRTLREISHFSPSDCREAFGDDCWDVNGILQKFSKMPTDIKEKSSQQLCKMTLRRFLGRFKVGEDVTFKNNARWEHAVVIATDIKECLLLAMVSTGEVKKIDVLTTPVEKSDRINPDFTNMLDSLRPADEKVPKKRGRKKKNAEV